jgi:hypothetical protein
MRATLIFIALCLLIEPSFAQKKKLKKTDSLEIQKYLKSINEEYNSSSFTEGSALLSPDKAFKLYTLSEPYKYVGASFVRTFIHFNYQNTEIRKEIYISYPEKIYVIKDGSAQKSYLIVQRSAEIVEGNLENIVINMCHIRLEKDSVVFNNIKYMAFFAKDPMKEDTWFQINASPSCYQNEESGLVLSYDEKIQEINYQRYHTLPDEASCFFTKGKFKLINGQFVEVQRERK